ncbi:MAG: acyl-CoA thioester hydrolase [Saprospiraceae bacterium]|jgi:acyl-CoA thioester hydrolase
MVTATFEKRVRYSETDKMGYLYYGRYAALYEVGRAELIRDLGVSYHDFEEIHKVMMPVVNLECRYKYPAHYDDMVTIHTTIKEMPSRMITFHHKIINKDGKVLNLGVVKLFFVDMISGQKVSCPPFLKEVILPFF